MPTGTIILTPGAATLPDGSASNLAPALQAVKSSATAPGVYFLQAAFDDTAEEWLCWAFRLPDDYASAPVVKLQFKMAAAITGVVVWDVRISATTPGDLQDVDAQDFAAANTVTATVPGNHGRLTEETVSVANNDSLAAGDFVVVRVARVAADAADTASGDAELTAITLAYTTT